ncbi:MAG: chemotaxis protein CheB [Parvibaculum sp.]|uniref:chemotaxis protein CheB n=1 Tax=Parvibaculum sp. TaxID=2024848 RepID=UPI002849E119|nr:chemotaxis protein CheB [Parvibaculum sp.]MDR3498781.1 chemotaxis protein CheB [Parvibaculum sp.]
MQKSRPKGPKPARARSGKRAVPARAPPSVAEHITVVGIGASAGGLDACRKLARALPADNGMAFILIQHLDPTHESMMVDLLAGHTSMTVRQAADGMRIERNNFYVIPPGAYLAVAGGALHLSQPKARHGARMPFDFLLQSMADDCGPRAVAVILSGTGTDGSTGLKALKEKGGFVIVQDPDEATYDGMPRNAIITGVVDLVLPVDEMADALIEHNQLLAHEPGGADAPPMERPHDFLPEVVDLLRRETSHDFTLYKRGTLRRRIERRMSMTAGNIGDMGRYLEFLHNDPVELGLLAQDLLINVTAFFRDRQVFDLLADKIVPDLVRNQLSEHPIRIWIAGCSTGEEAYSIAMLFREQITASKHNVKLQVFASDVDPDAIATAREGLYPETIEADVTPARLARFFSKEEHGYRVSPELRAAVVFTVHDVLIDPPFSRLDFISCRNLLIYLRPEAQAKAISVFHFALRESGILLLGSSETISNFEGRFEVISKPERLYRHIGRSSSGEFGFPISFGEGMRIPARPGQGQAPSRQATLADLCRRLVMETYAPAAVLINRKHKCLHSVGPIDRYLHVAPGQPSHDLFAMARQGMTGKLRPAIQQATREKMRVVVAGGRTDRKGEEVRFHIDIQPVLSDGEDLLLICFVDEAKSELSQTRPAVQPDVPRVAELEQELEAAREELRGAIRDLELSSEDQKAINEEALSVNEEYQSTNEELLTSQEELQSLNEELTALNSQLQETLERQRTTSNDLQNVLYSTDVATLFLDSHLNIRFFTPATKSLFNVIPGDVGRPLADLHSLVADEGLLIDCRSVLATLTTAEREVEASRGGWFIRRISPFRAHSGAVEGVVITFTDITERKHIAKALEAAKLQADLANMAKSRFLAAASHDLRQPLQTLALLQGLLAKMVQGAAAQKLVKRLDQTLGAMSGMLNTLLDLNQIEAGTVRAEKVAFPINDLLDRLREEFTYSADAQGLSLRVVSCGLPVFSDPHLLGQMLRNLLSNALKYTASGKVLVGCRRHKGMLSIQVLDSGVGIPADELEAIFEEYHQLDNDARERSRGLGLGLSIVRRLGEMLDHKVAVRSQPGRGSFFSVEVALPAAATQAVPEQEEEALKEVVVEKAHRGGTILVVEDDPEVRELLELLLTGEGHRVTTAVDGVAGLELVANGTTRPDLLLADYNLPNGLNGLQVASKLRANLRREIPVIILTGDISTETLRNIAIQRCVQLNKPVKLSELTQTILRLLPAAPATSLARKPHAVERTPHSAAPVIYVVDDDANIRAGVRGLLEEDGRAVEDFASCEAFLAAYRPGGEACLLIDAYLPGMSGMELLQRLNDDGHSLPSIMITGNSDVAMAVQAMKAGASDFIEKPVGRADLIASIDRALERSRDAGKELAWRETAADNLAGLTARQREIMDMVLAGHPSKNIAADLGISQRTVENHRASIMRKTGSKSLPALARLALAAASNKPF